MCLTISYLFGAFIKPVIYDWKPFLFSNCPGFGYNAFAMAEIFVGIYDRNDVLTSSVIGIALNSSNVCNGLDCW